MKIKAALLVLVATLLGAGCVIAPEPYATYGPYDDYSPPQEYLADAPVYYAAHPGVAFYPLFINAPGSCFCVVPMRFYGGVWYGVDGVVLHRGHFAYTPAARIESRHISAWRNSGGVVHGMQPARGTVQTIGGKPVVRPPEGTLHRPRPGETRVLRDPTPIPIRTPPPGPRPEAVAPAAPPQQPVQRHVPAIERERVTPPVPPAQQRPTEQARERQRTEPAAEPQRRPTHPPAQAPAERPASQRSEPAKRCTDDDNANQKRCERTSR